jgi:hypothetical protein
MCLAGLFASVCLPELEKCVASFVQHISANSFLTLELELHQHLKILGDHVVEALLQETFGSAAFVAQCIEEYRAKGYRVHKRNQQTTIQLYGGRSVTVQTAYLLPKRKPSKRKGRGRRGKQGQGIYPVLKKLGIMHHASPALQNEATLSALNNPFAEATESMNRHGVAVSEKRIRTLSESVGQTALHAREAELEQFQADLLLQGETFAGQRVVIAIDGGRTCTRRAKKSRMKSGQKRQGFHAEWREPKLLTLYAIDEKGQKRNRDLLPYYDGTHGGRERFKLLLKMSLHKMGVLKAAHTIFIGDGAPWVWNLVEEIIKELNLKPETVTQILDYYHACENLWKVIDALSGLTPKQKRRCYKKAKAQLLQGQIEKLIESLGQKAKAHAAALQALKYFHGHEARCRYDLFLHQHLPLGSGAIESAIRRVVNLRLKGAGMFWLEHNAEAFLHLRCQLKTGRWEGFFQNLISP